MMYVWSRCGPPKRHPMSVIFRGASSCYQRNKIKQENVLNTSGHLMHPICPGLSLNSENVIRFVVRHLEIPDIELPKSDIITLTWYLGRCKVKNIGIGLTFCTPVVIICLYNLYFAFDVFQFLFLWAFFLNRSFFRSKNKKKRKYEIVILWSV